LGDKDILVFRPSDENICGNIIRNSEILGESR